MKLIIHKNHIQKIVQLNAAALLLLILMSGCGSLINDIDPDKIPNNESKLVVECYISPQIAKIQVVVTESQPLYGPSTIDPVYIKNAKVVLSGDGREITIPYDDSTKRYFIDSSAFRIEAGKVYHLSVNDGKRLVKAECTVPAKVPVIKSYIFDSIPGQYMDTLVRIRFEWDDIPGEKNYYSLQGYAAYDQTWLAYFDAAPNWRPVRGTTRTVLFNTISEVLLLNDINLDGITFKSPESRVQLPWHYIFTYKDDRNDDVKVYSNPVFNEVRMEVLNVDKNYYDYHRSLADNDDNPFVEPTLVYSNIEGGLGCFGSYTVGIRIIKR